MQCILKQQRTITPVFPLSQYTGLHVAVCQESSCRSSPHSTSILYMFVLLARLYVKRELVMHGGGRFPNRCSWNAISLIMYSRFTVTAQRHTEEEHKRAINWEYFCQFCGSNWVNTVPLTRHGSPNLLILVFHLTSSNSHC